jgi:hypothetical protein
MNWKSTDQSSYLVEVSGWDHFENFFVECSTMEWASGGTRKVALRNALREGTIVFVRLSQPLSPNSNLPVAFQIKTIGAPDGQNRAESTLIQLHPRGQKQNSVPAPNLVHEEIPVC